MQIPLVPSGAAPFMVSVGWARPSAALETALQLATPNLIAILAGDPNGPQQKVAPSMSAVASTDSVAPPQISVVMTQSQSLPVMAHLPQNVLWDTMKAGVLTGLAMPEDIPIGAYNHLNFAFAYIDPTTFQVAPMAADQVDLYNRTTALKALNNGMEVWISIGGWTMNDADQPTASTFSNLAASSSAQASFFASLVSFMETYGFDGVDIDWEYPAATDRSGVAADYENYVTFLQNLKTATGASGHKYGLSITIPSSYWYMQHFDIVNIAKVVDWFNLMSYDLHGTWDSTDEYIGPYVYAHTNLTEIDESLQLLWRNDINGSQINLGLGFYGRSFTLSDSSCTEPGCEFSAGGNAGNCTQNVGTLSYAEIQDVIAGGAIATLDSAAAVKQLVWDDNQWVSYDDAYTLGLKLDYANKHCLGGTMIWAVSLDTSDGKAAEALSTGTSEVSGTGQIALSEDSVKTTYDASGQCFITDGAKSPTGWGAVQQVNGNKQDVKITHGCSDGQKRTYCCPEDDMPT
ncbi:glycoside hydrolase family 18 protein [Penicillium lividum]|nr:glycoside hydrolase family 18 protein [Penicillium lividum]